ncbi:MAG TPA: hypothetical protein VFX79_00075 [Candidatus Saccharimonadales bacterium]|nr:hypothetical protein [Candidatus Saccharimonadales bacterium]
MLRYVSMLDKMYLNAEVFVPYERARKTVFRKLQEGSSVEFNEAMEDEQLITVADGVKRIMDELKLSEAKEIAEAFGHEVREANIRGLGITSTRRSEPTPIRINKTVSPRLKEFGIYHELGHHILFEPTGVSRRGPVSPNQEEVYCDAYACLMIGNKMPPRPLRPQHL